MYTQTSLLIFIHFYFHPFPTVEPSPQQNHKSCQNVFSASKKLHSHHPRIHYQNCPREFPLFFETKQALHLSVARANLDGVCESVRKQKCNRDRHSIFINIIWFCKFSAMISYDQYATTSDYEVDLSTISNKAFITLSGLHHIPVHVHFFR